jgi:hypothetical protein
MERAESGWWVVTGYGGGRSTDWQKLRWTRIMMRIFPHPSVEHLSKCHVSQRYPIGRLVKVDKPSPEIEFVLTMKYPTLDKR